MTTNYQQKQSVSHSQVTTILFAVLRFSVSIALTMLIGRELSPADFGFFALVLMLFIMARELMDMGSTSLAIREIALNPQNERSVLEMVVGLRVSTGSFLAVVCLVLAWQQDFQYQMLVLTSVALVLPLLSYWALGAVYQLRQYLQPPAIIGLTLQFGLLVGCYALYFLRAPVWTYPAMLVLREVLELLWLKAHAGKTLGYTIRPDFNHTKTAY